MVLQEIVDETDRYIDNLRLQRVNAALLTSNLPRHLRKCEPFTWGLLCGPSRVAPLTGGVPPPGCAGCVACPRRDVRSISPCMWISMSLSWHAAASQSHCAWLGEAGVVAPVRSLARQQITRIGHLAQLRGGQITRPHPPDAHPPVRPGSLKS